MQNHLRAMALLPLLSLSLALSAQQERPAAGYDRASRATVLHVAQVYVAADIESQHITTVTPGHEVVIMGRSSGWVRVFANTDVEEQREEDTPEFLEDENVTPKSGWIRDKGVLGAATANGATLLYGAAATAEAEAAEPHAPKTAAGSAYLLYRRMAEYFPDSPLAPEAAWRSADIRWQLGLADARTLPSAKEQDPNLRPRMYDNGLKKVMKNYPGTKYAALAAYDLLAAKLCGDWQGLPKCPAQESDLYEKYASQFPDSPKAAEALWNAAYRQGVLVSMYAAEENKKHTDSAAQHAHAIAEIMKQKYPQSDYTLRATTLVYKVEQSIPIYGNDRD